MDGAGGVGGFPSLEPLGFPWFGSLRGGAVKGPWAEGLE